MLVHRVVPQHRPIVPNSNLPWAEAQDLEDPDALQAPDPIVAIATPAEQAALTADLDLGTPIAELERLLSVMRQDRRRARAPFTVTGRLATRVLHLAATWPDRSVRPLFYRVGLLLHLCAGHVRQPTLKHVCPRCARRAAIRTRQRLELRLLWVGPGQLLHIIATLPQRDLVMAAALLRERFAALRQQPCWHDWICGGAYQIALKPSKGGQVLPWLPHLHISAQLWRPYLPNAVRDELRRQWSELLGAVGHVGNFRLLRRDAGWVVDRRGRPSSKHAHYITKRVRRPWLDYDDPTLGTLVLAHLGVRLYSQFGAWAGGHRGPVPGATWGVDVVPSRPEGSGSEAQPPGRRSAP